MPEVGILLSQDKQLFWHFGLMLPCMRPYSCPDKYNSADAAFAAAKIELNRRGLFSG